MSAELDAISLYEQMAAMTDNEDIKKVMLDIAKEEKEQVGEFDTLLRKIDQEYVDEYKEGGEEVKELTEEQ